MEPITLGIGLLVLMAMGKKKPTTAEAAKTASAVDQLSDALVEGGPAAAQKIITELEKQIQAMGLVTGGVGHPPNGPGGSTFTAYVANKPASLITQAELEASGLSQNWDALKQLLFIQSKDGALDQAETQAFIVLANKVAATVFELTRFHEGRVGAAKV